MTQQDPHATQPILHTGTKAEQATIAMILIHGRGASAEDILSLSGEFERPDVAYFAPQAAGNTWYPQRFIAPLAVNQPWLDSALQRIDTLLAHTQAAGIPLERTFLLGFSQGACLALEYAARNARRYAGVIGLSGGLIGPDGTPREYPGSLDGTPILLGCSDVDFHIPKQRVIESGEVLGRIGGSVDLRLYPGMGHTVNQDEIEAIKALLSAVSDR
ncbi:MAG: dienelactone hydrolase family protein [Roseiflexaceae bacterium]